MAATTTLNSKNPINSLPSKAAEIYREETGDIYYVCFHCGYNSSSVTDMLTHIEVHFSCKNDIYEALHCVDVKSEPTEQEPEYVIKQLEQIFTDCSTKTIENSFPADETNHLILPDQPALSDVIDGFADLQGLFEWKCLLCNILFKKSTKLKQHLIKHSSDPMKRVIDEKKKEMKALYSFKCTLCSLEFYDATASEQHLEDAHRAVPPLIKCIPCSIEFVSATFLKEHMTVAHSKQERSAIEDTSSESCGRYEMPAAARYEKCFCTICRKTLIGTFRFMQHTFTHFDLKMFCCPKCPSNFTRMDTFNKHMRSKHSQKPEYAFICRFCEDTFDHSNLFSFVTHAFEHHLDDGDRNNSGLNETFNYSCRFCYKGFDRWIDASTHLSQHADDELPKGLPCNSDRLFSERCSSGAYRSEFLYNCSICTSTLCGSYEARKHLIEKHQIADHVTVKRCTMDHKLFSAPLQYRVISAKSNEPIKKKTNKCNDCDSIFETEIDLMRHRLQHFNVQPYFCPNCSMSFSSREQVSRHLLKKHGLELSYEQLICKFCGCEFSDDDEFIVHNFSDHLYINFDADDDLDDLCKYECRYCSEILDERRLMDQHLHTHTNDNITEVVDAEAEDCSINKLRHNDEFLYVCLQCPKKFRLPYVVKEHAKVVHHDKPKKESHCDLCDITFFSWHSLRNHQSKVHSGLEKKPVTSKNNVNEIVRKVQVSPRKKGRKKLEGNRCDICNNTFLSNRSMINHRTKRHPETVDNSLKHQHSYTCAECGKTIADISNFHKHRETHEKRHSFTCDICSKTYRLKNSLQTHMLIHTEEKNFVCEECGKSFYTTSKLNLHKQVHENLTFHCDKCGKVFYTRNNFSKHKKTHLDNARKKCTMCDNTFKSSVSLRIHMLLHEREKKYTCRYCDMTFAQSSGRRGHEKVKHDIA
ncbi:Zinc finger protein [Pseudolycoriella hygida]|uniref:Zinc finger protein n=1 Tax=Pseudolycoriella hygida TaxID=35572 RepID=A0A9Q0N298_9DIPT|nr:Zinc finger protein [Pseudolycoriella hygida]